MAGKPRKPLEIKQWRVAYYRSYHPVVGYRNLTHVYIVEATTHAEAMEQVPKQEKGRGQFLLVRLMSK